MAFSSSPLAREAFTNAGERRYLVSRLFYSAIFGRQWESALIGWAYIKCLDDAVDEELSTDKALAVIATQRQLVATIYGGRSADETLAVPESYGRSFFAYDAAHGARRRGLIETIIDTMEYDVRRRHTLVPAARLDAYIIELGSAIIRYTASFLRDGGALPDRFIRTASRAYLYADALIDLEHDLRFGVINIPCEDVTRLQLNVTGDDPKQLAWIAERAPVVFEYFAEALAETRRLSGLRVRVLAHLFLSRKRAQLARFLNARRVATARPYRE